MVTMAIELADMITPEKKELIRKIDQTIDELMPAIEQLAQEGIPVEKHLEELKVRKEWVTKFKKLFKVN